jgi:hypothetical protein
VEGFASLGGSFEQFAEMQRDAYEVLGHLQREQARQGNEQRHQTDLLRRSLATTTLLLQRHSQSPGPPAARPGPDLAGELRRRPPTTMSTCTAPTTTARFRSCPIEGWPPFSPRTRSGSMGARH